MLMFNDDDDNYSKITHATWTTQGRLAVRALLTAPTRKRQGPVGVITFATWLWSQQNYQRLLKSLKCFEISKGCCSSNLPEGRLMLKMNKRQFFPTGPGKPLTSLVRGWASLVGQVQWKTCLSVGSGPASARGTPYLTLAQAQRW